VHRAPVPGFVTPYLLSIVLLEEGASLLTHLVDVPDGDHGNGARLLDRAVRVRFRRVNQEITLPEFVLAD
jgi:hypothetical protein